MENKKFASRVLAFTELQTKLAEAELARARDLIRFEEADKTTTARIAKLMTENDQKVVKLQESLTAALKEKVTPSTAHPRHTRGTPYLLAG